MKTRRHLLRLLALSLLTVTQAAPANPAAASDTPAPFRRAQRQSSYLRETFGLLPATPLVRPAIPDPANREEAFAILLKALQENRMESSRQRANRLLHATHPVESQAVAFLSQTLGGANASNPVARAVHRHLDTEAGRQELLVSLGVSQSKKSR